jgi:glucosylceramidase
MLALVFSGLAFTSVTGIQSSDGSYGGSITALKLVSEAPAGDKIVIDVTKKYQEILGFGCGFSEASSYLWCQMNPTQQAEVLEALFGPTGVRHSFGRIIIGGCDFSLGAPYVDLINDSKDLCGFSLQHEEQYLIPFAKAAKSKCPEYGFWGTPCTPPAFMKTNHDLMRGGKLLPEYRALYAKYITLWVKGMTDHGIRPWGLTIQNEPEYGGPGTWWGWECCLWTGEEEGHYAVENLRPTLDAAGFKDVKIIGWDSNRDRTKLRADAIASVAGVDKAIWGLCNHWYLGGHWDQVDYVHEKYGSWSQMMGEFCIADRGWSDENWTDAVRYIIEIMNDLNHWQRVVAEWNIILDENGGPNNRTSRALAEVRDRKSVV